MRPQPRHRLRELGGVKYESVRFGHSSSSARTLYPCTISPLRFGAKANPPFWGDGHRGISVGMASSYPSVPFRFFWIAVAGTICISGVYLYAFFVSSAGFPYGNELLKDHYAAMVGLPAGAAVSFILVVLLRQTEGPIEFEGLGFKFKGAAGQVAMWVVCFLAFAGAIKLCW
jgi:hypothetical protein